MLHRPGAQGARSESHFGHPIPLHVRPVLRRVPAEVRARPSGGEIPVTGIYFGLCWLSLGVSLLLLTVGLWNATLSNSKKGFYAMAYLFSLFAVVAIQKNVRDVALIDERRARRSSRRTASDRQRLDTSR